MKYLFIALSIFVISGTLLLASDLDPVDPDYNTVLRTYTLKDLGISKEIKYFDVKYYYYTKGDKRYRYGGGWSFDQKAYHELSVKEKQKIRASFPSIRQKGYASVRRGNMSTHYFIHYMDKHSRVFIVDTYSKLKRFSRNMDESSFFKEALMNQVVVH